MQALCAAHSISWLWRIRLSESVLASIKSRFAAHYLKTREQILHRICHGSLLHVDETQFCTKSQTGYVWVFTSLTEVAYFYSETRESEFLHKLVPEFQGVLVTDFYAAYDSMECSQQKCLIHLIRDMNDEVLDQPFDEHDEQLKRTFAPSRKAGAGAGGRVNPAHRPTHRRAQPLTPTAHRNLVAADVRRLNSLLISSCTKC